MIKEISRIKRTRKLILLTLSMFFVFTYKVMAQTQTNPYKLMYQAVDSFHNGNYQQVLSLSKKGLAILNEQSDIKQNTKWFFAISACYDVMAQSYQYLGRVDSALLFYERALKVTMNNERILISSEELKFRIMGIRNRYAYLKIKLGLYEEALKILDLNYKSSALENLIENNYDNPPYYDYNLTHKPSERAEDYRYLYEGEDLLEYILFYDLYATKKALKDWRYVVNNYGHEYHRYLLLSAECHIALGDSNKAYDLLELACIVYENMKLATEPYTHKDNLIYTLNWVKFNFLSTYIKYRTSIGISFDYKVLVSFNQIDMKQILSEFENETSPYFQPFFDLLKGYISYLYQWREDREEASGLLDHYMITYDSTTGIFYGKILYMDALRLSKAPLIFDVEEYKNLTPANSLNQRDRLILANKKYKQAIKTSLKYYEESRLSLSLDEQNKFWVSIQYMIQGYYKFVIEEILSSVDYSSFKEQILSDILEVQLLTKGKSLDNTLKLKQGIYKSGDDKLIGDYNTLLRLKGDYSAIILDTSSISKNEKLLIVKQKIKDLEIDLLSQINHSGFVDYKTKEIQAQLRSDEALVEIIKLDYMRTSPDTYYPKKYEFEGNDSRRRVVVGKNISGENLYSKTPIHHLTGSYIVNQIASDRQNAYLVIIVKNDKIFHRLIVDGDLLEGNALNYYQNAISFQIIDSLSYSKFFEKIIEGDQRDQLEFFGQEEDGTIAYWMPSSFQLKDIKKIYISPDGVYNLINPSAIYNPNTQDYLYKNHDFTFISSPRYFFNTDTTTLTNKEIFLFGNPTYTGEKQTVYDTIFQNKREILNLFNGVVPELPGTQEEVSQIKEIMDLKYETNVFLKNDATEENLRKVDQPNILHIATHGYYKNMKGGTSIDQMTRSGLLLAGFMSGTDQFTDGIFTSQEASSLNLTNTDLVVLSACQSGLGKIQNGEGVYGLQRVFIVAGAKNIISSLWSIDDSATSKWMTLFYRNLHDHENIELSFKKTVNALREEYKHPYYWGAFILLKN